MRDIIQILTDETADVAINEKKKTKALTDKNVRILKCTGLQSIKINWVIIILCNKLT